MCNYFKCTRFPLQRCALCFSSPCNVFQDIYLHNPDVKWGDIIGLDAAKRLVKEAVVYPIKVRKPQRTT